jgi:ferrous iron transport protein A
LGESSVRLSELPRRTGATVVAVDDASPNDAIARRLRELGFVAGERVEVVAAGPLGAEPLLVQVGYTRFALRRREAARVEVRLAETVQAARRQRAPEAAQA